MVLPGQDPFDIPENGVPSVALATSVPHIIGYASALPENDPRSFSRIIDLVATCGQGPAVEDAAYILANYGGSVRVTKPTCSVAGALSAVVESGVAGPDVTVTGTPNDFYDVKVEITKAGALGTAEFKYSLDGGQEYQEGIVTPTGLTYLIPNTGVTLTFTAGTQNVGTIHSFTATPPMYNSTNLGQAFTAIAALPTLQFDFFSLAGRAATASAGATLHGGFQTQLAALASTHFRHFRGIMDVGIDTTSNVLSSYAAVTGVRVCRSYGTFRAPSAKPFPGWAKPHRSLAGAVAYFAARSLISTDLMRVASGPIPGCDAISHNEFTAESLHAAKIATARTYPQYSDFFLTGAPLASAAGSDFSDWHLGRVMDVACNIVYRAQVLFLGRTTRVLGAGGKIDPKEAAAFEREVQEQLDIALMQPTNAEGTRGHVTSVTYQLDRENNVLQTGYLNSHVTLVSRPSIKRVKSTLNFATATPVALEAAA
jgi:hypothetical protein